jgi:hypothetical protein
MGQYYVYAMIEEPRVTGWSPRRFGGGVKLCEHSYVHNDNVTLLYSLLADKALAKEIKSLAPVASWAGKWSGKKVAQVGDYAEIRTSSDESIYDLISEKKGAFAENILKKIKPEINGWEFSSHALNSIFDCIVNYSPLYAINLDNGEYLNITAHMFVNAAFENKNKDNFNGDFYHCYDPVSLLIATEAGGGGDYYRDYKEEIGRWLGARLTLSRTKPTNGKDITKDFFFGELKGDYSNLFTPYIDAYNKGFINSKSDFISLAVSLSKQNEVAPVLVIPEGFV